MIVLCGILQISQKLIEELLNIYSRYGRIWIVPVGTTNVAVKEFALFNRKINEEFNGLYWIQTKNIPYVLGTETWTRCFSKLIKDSGQKLIMLTDNISAATFKITGIEEAGFNIEWCIIREQSKKSIKKVLLTGVESCGKTTLTTMLAKRFSTTYTYEYGRDYSYKCFNGNDDSYCPGDFFDIAFYQQRLERDAFKTANRVVFFDTDIVLTQFYCEVFCGKKDEGIEYMIKRCSYDLILFLDPGIEWIKDEIRFMGTDDERKRYSERLFQLYAHYGFAPKMKTVTGTFHQRYGECEKCVLQVL